jgi:hypothetical protein
MACKVKWNKDGWICTTQMNSFRFPEEMTHCWFSNCQGRSPRPVQVITPKPKLILSLPKTLPSQPVCSYVNCTKPQAPNRKYCGDPCRKRQARWAYRQRAKQIT